MWHWDSLRVMLLLMKFNKANNDSYHNPVTLLRAIRSTREASVWTHDFSKPTVCTNNNILAETLLLHKILVICCRPSDKNFRV